MDASVGTSSCPAAMEVDDSATPIKARVMTDVEHRALAERQRLMAERWKARYRQQQVRVAACENALVLASEDHARASTALFAAQADAAACAATVPGTLGCEEYDAERLADACYNVRGRKYAASIAADALAKSKAALAAALSWTTAHVVDDA